MSDRDINPRGRRAACACCGRKTTVRGGQTWRHRIYDVLVTIISAERDGAIVEQEGRPGGERFAVNYRDLLEGYRRTA